MRCETASLQYQSDLDRCVQIKCVNFLANSSIDLDEIQFDADATACWYVEARAKIYFAQVVFKGANCADGIL